VFLIVVIAACSSCDRSSTGTTGHASADKKSSTPFEVRLESADAAVKTWWRYIDWRAREWRYSALAAQMEFSGPCVDISTGPVAAYCKPTFTMTSDLFERQIEKVQQESETRAVVLARVKNVTPIPPGAQPSEFEKELRDQGFYFRYVVERTEGGWKVARVFRYDATSKDWREAYEVPSSPMYPAGMGDQ
jgi:hypothetical protein